MQFLKHTSAVGKTNFLFQTTPERASDSAEKPFEVPFSAAEEIFVSAEAGMNVRRLKSDTNPEAVNGEVFTKAAKGESMRFVRVIDNAADFDLPDADTRIWGMVFLEGQSEDWFAVALTGTDGKSLNFMNKADHEAAEATRDTALNEEIVLASDILNNQEATKASNPQAVAEANRRGLDINADSIHSSGNLRFGLGRAWYEGATVTSTSTPPLRYQTGAHTSDIPGGFQETSRTISYRERPSAYINDGQTTFEGTDRTADNAAEAQDLMAYETKTRPLVDLIRSHTAGISDTESFAKVLADKYEVPGDFANKDAEAAHILEGLTQMGITDEQLDVYKNTITAHFELFNLRSFKTRSALFLMPTVSKMHQLAGFLETGQVPAFKSLQTEAQEYAETRVDVSGNKMEMTDADHQLVDKFAEAAHLDADFIDGKLFGRRGFLWLGRENKETWNELKGEMEKAIAAETGSEEQVAAIGKVVNILDTELEADADELSVEIEAELKAEKYAGEENAWHSPEAVDVSDLMDKMGTGYYRGTYTGEFRIYHTGNSWKTQAKRVKKNGEVKWTTVDGDSVTSGGSKMENRFMSAPSRAAFFEPNQSPELRSQAATAARSTEDYTMRKAAIDTVRGKYNIGRIATGEAISVTNQSTGERVTSQAREFTSRSIRLQETETMDRGEYVSYAASTFRGSPLAEVPNAPGADPRGFHANLDAAEAMIPPHATIYEALKHSKPKGHTGPESCLELVALSWQEHTGVALKSHELQQMLNVTQVPAHQMTTAGRLSTSTGYAEFTNTNRTPYSGEVAKAFGGVSPDTPIWRMDPIVITRQVQTQNGRVMEITFEADVFALKQNCANPFIVPITDTAEYRYVEPGTTTNYAERKVGIPYIHEEVVASDFQVSFNVASLIHAAIASYGIGQIGGGGGGYLDKVLPGPIKPPTGPGL